jgi:hypothetical protein
MMVVVITRDFPKICVENAICGTVWQESMRLVNTSMEMSGQPDCDVVRHGCLSWHKAAMRNVIQCLLYHHHPVLFYLLVDYFTQFIAKLK